MTKKPWLYGITIVTMLAALESCDRLGEITNGLNMITKNQAILEAKIDAVSGGKVSTELPKLQFEVENGKTNWFYQFGSRKVYVPGE